MQDLTETGKSQGRRHWSKKTDIFDFETSDFVWLIPEMLILLKYY